MDTATTCVLFFGLIILLILILALYDRAEGWPKAILEIIGEVILAIIFGLLGG